MAKFLPLAAHTILENGAYYKTRLKQAEIVKRQKLLEGELFKAMNSNPVEIMAFRMTEHFFPLSRDLAIYQDMVQLNKALLVLAPLLQKQPNSMLFDWHQGTVLSYIKSATNRIAARYFFNRVELSRSLDHSQLIENLLYLQLFEEKLSHVLVELFRNYYGRPSVTGKLANSLFDPIMFCHCTEAQSIRVGNTLLLLKKHPFENCVDLREQSATVLAYRLRKHEGREQGYLEIHIDEQFIANFKKRVERIMRSGLSARFKMQLIERQMNRFMGAVRYARSAFMQIVELSRWLRDKISPLKPAVEEAAYFHKIFVNRFSMGLDTKRYPTRRPNFFFDPHKHDVHTFIKFFSPYREEG